MKEKGAAAREGYWRMDITFQTSKVNRRIRAVMIREQRLLELRDKHSHYFCLAARGSQRQPAAGANGGTGNPACPCPFFIA